MKKDLKYYRENAEEDYLTTPISVLRYIGEIERRNSKLGLIASILFIVVFLSFYGGIAVGEVSSQNRIKNRAKKIEEKECSTQQDIELIIFNEPQL